MKRFLYFCGGCLFIVFGIALLVLVIGGSILPVTFWNAVTFMAIIASVVINISIGLAAVIVAFQD